MKNLTGKRMYVLNIFETSHLPTHHPILQATTQWIQLLQWPSISLCQEDRSGNKYEKKKSPQRKREGFFFLKCWVEEFGYYWRWGKMKEVIHDKEPRYEETTLVSETGSVEAEPRLSLSCCSKPHIYHTGTSPARKDPHRQPWRGADLLKWLDDPEYQRVAGLWDERRPCLGLCLSMWL